MTAHTNGAAPSHGAFPDLTIELPPSAQLSGSAQPGQGQSVAAALRDVLGWRPRTADAKGFVAALDQAFTITDVDGHTEWAWTPRSYMVQADMGAVTGAQASVHQRARAALDQARPLIEGLYALRPDADTEDIEATRSLVLAQIEELVSELGMVGGPRLQRVDGLFDTLLGEAADHDEPDEVDGLFGLMRTQFGLERVRVNYLPEEHNLTNFRISADLMLGMRRSWNGMRHYFDRHGSDVFLGTQLVQLSRSLAVVAESVQQICFVLDSVFIGAADRQTVLLDSGLTIEELLSWVERFAIEEAPRLIREAGKEGVATFRPTLRSLSQLVAQALHQSRQGGGGAQAGFRHPRVQTSFDELDAHLRRAVQLVDQLKRSPTPNVLAVEPTPAPLQNHVRLTVDGANFQEGAQVYLTPRGPATDRLYGTQVTFVSPAQIKATFDLRDTAGTEWAVVVQNPDGESGALPLPFVVDPDQRPPDPDLHEVSPDHAPNSGSVALVIEGCHFDLAGVTVLLMRGDRVLKRRGTLEGANVIHANFNLQGLTAGDWEVQVENRSGGISNALSFEIAEPPTISNAVASELDNNETQIAIDGSGFTAGAIVKLYPPRKGGEPITIEDDDNGTVEVDPDGTQIIAQVDVGERTLNERWRVQVINPDGGASSKRTLRIDEDEGSNIESAGFS